MLRTGGYNAWIVNTDNDPDREQAHVESLRLLQVEGLIVATARVEHPLLVRLHEQGVKMVLVNRRVDGVEIPAITTDDPAGVAAAVRHLVALGHRRIARLAGPYTTSSGVVRARAFRHALYEIGAEAARLLLDLIDEPDRTIRSVVLPLSLIERGSTGPVAPKA